MKTNNLPEKSSYMDLGEFLLIYFICLAIQGFIISNGIIWSGLKHFSPSLDFYLSKTFLGIFASNTFITVLLTCGFAVQDSLDGRLSETGLIGLFILNPLLWIVIRLKGYKIMQEN